MKYKTILLSLILLVVLISSGCIDSKSEDKFVTLIINTGFLVIDTDSIPNKNDYRQYDEHTFVQINNFEEPNYPSSNGDLHVTTEILSFDITQPTEYTIKSSGFVKFKCSPCSENAEVDISVVMVVRDYKGNIISQEDTKLKMVNDKSIPFTIQSFYKGT